MDNKVYKAMVLENRQLTDEIFQIVCRLEDESDFEYVAGQYVFFEKDIDGQKVKRAYS